MSNHYMTEQYMSSILEQYQQNSPQKTTENVSQFGDFLENAEQNRRQLNESLFKSIDDSFDRQKTQMSAETLEKERMMAGTPSLAQQMVRTPLITSDSFRKPKPVETTNSRSMGQHMRGRANTAVYSVRSQYLYESLPPTRVTPQTYRAKVIDYSNEYSNGRSVSNTPSVLTERNTDPIQRTAQSVSAIHSAITSISQKPFERPIIKPILKNTAQLKPLFSEQIPNSLTNNQRYVDKPNGVPKLSPFSSEVIPIEERDSLVNGFKDNGIIRTLDLDKNETFYCFYCNIYLEKIEKHCKNETHISNKMKTKENPLNNQLNKRFAQNDSLDTCGLNAQNVFRIELNRIRAEDKHYYYVKGIRLKNPVGTNPYYCRFCEQSIPSLDNIESHLKSDSHLNNEKRTTFSKFLSQTTEPIVGLQYITEYMSPDLFQPEYECTICKCFEGAYDMYLHVCSFKHRLNLLKKYNPNEVSLNRIQESPQAIKEIKKRINYLSQKVSIGAIVKVRDSPNEAKIRKMIRQKRYHSDVEVIDITDDDEEKPSDLKKLSLRVTTEDEAADASIVIQALKESVVKYYLSKIPTQMRRVLINRVMDDEEVMDLDLNL